MISKKLFMIGGKAGFSIGKSRESQSADHHDREFWERYFKLCQLT
jgi:hypothetical protein